jgi:hypothetical protein
METERAVRNTARCPEKVRMPYGVIFLREIDNNMDTVHIV